MWLIVGLGNPGFKYRRTRHNVGFMLINELASCHGIRVKKKMCHSITGTGYIGGVKVMLVKAQTFMNNSGLAVYRLIDYFDIAFSRLIVVYDDLDLDMGIIRVRKKGSHGGHKGMKSIIQHIGTPEFPRLRIGIGPKPLDITAVDYVLGVFSREQKKLMDKTLDNAVSAVECILEYDIDTAMNRFN